MQALCHSFMCMMRTGVYDTLFSILSMENFFIWKLLLMRKIVFELITFHSFVMLDHLYYMSHAVRFFSLHFCFLAVGFFRCLEICRVWLKADIFH